MFFVGLSAQVIPFLLPFIFALLFLSGEMKEGVVVEQNSTAFTITYQPTASSATEKNFHIDSWKTIFSETPTAQSQKATEFSVEASNDLSRTNYLASTYHKYLFFACGQKAPPIC